MIGVFHHDGEPSSAGTMIRSALVYLVLALVSAAFLFPLAWMVSVSLQDVRGVFAQPFNWIPSAPQWNNYGDVATLLPFGRFLLNTVVVTVLVVAGTLFSCSLVAYGFSRIRFRGRTVLFSICLATMMLPGQVTMIPLYIMFARMGWVDTLWPLIVPSFFGAPFYIFLLRQFFLTIPREYDEAARLDGAGRFRIYWSIILPMARPAMITVALFSFIGTWNDFFTPLIYINSPENATLTLGLNMLKSQIVGTGMTQWHLLMAAACMVMIPNILLFALGQRYLVKGIAMGGLR